MGGSGESIHLTFKKLPKEKGHKLHKYKVHNINYRADIGVIHWRGSWRQYVFQAHPEIDMSRGCHKQIDKFIDKLMDGWKKRKAPLQPPKEKGV